MLNDVDELVRILGPYLPRRQGCSILRRMVTNGAILDHLRVSITLRYLAGGSVYDIAHVHGVAVSTVYAIANCPALSISFPTDHTVQERIARVIGSLPEALERILPLMDRYEFSVQSKGGLPHGAFVGNGVRQPASLLDGSNHFDDVPSSERRSRQPE
jgi:hypothetical protein